MTVDAQRWKAVAKRRDARFVNTGVLPNKTAGYGFTSYLLTDRGREFCDAAATTLSAKLGISKRCTSPYPRRQMGSPKELSEFSSRKVFAGYGFQRYLVANRRKKFRHELAASSAAKRGISKRCKTPNRPEASGIAGRTTGVVADRLAKSAREAGPNWVKRLPAAPMAIRTSINFSTGIAPISPDGAENINSAARGISAQRPSTAGTPCPRSMWPSTARKISTAAI